MRRKHYIAFALLTCIISSGFAVLGVRAAGSISMPKKVRVTEAVYSKNYKKPDTSKDKPEKTTDHQKKPDYVMTATAYVDRGETKSRIHAGVGSVAVDRRVIPHGTLLYIEGYGLALATDTGRLIKGNRIDVWFPDEKTAIKWGRKQVDVWKVGEADIKKILSTGGKYVKY